MIGFPDITKDSSTRPPWPLNCNRNMERPEVNMALPPSDGTGAAWITRATRKRRSDQEADITIIGKLKNGVEFRPILLYLGLIINRGMKLWQYFNVKWLKNIVINFIQCFSEVQKD